MRPTLVVLLLTAATTAGAQASAPTPIPAPAPVPQLSAFPGQYAPSPSGWRFPVWPSGCGRFQADERQACLEFVAFDFGRLSRYAEANALLAPPKPGEGRVVFLGDSITDGWSMPQKGGFFPGKPYINRGISGQTTTQMLVRFRQDVIALQPAAVVILAGTNDISGNSGPVELATIEANLETMSELAKLHGIKVILASLLPVTDEKTDHEGRPRVWTDGRPPEKIQALNVWLADYARQNGHVYLDYFSAVVNGAGRLRSDLTDDGLHPNAAGHALMAPLAEKAIAQALAGGR